ncbi:MAG: bifunctional pyr operon transcriptional regulator/uracil phosphoribosyltransferase PyrR [Coriobacteriales bacterium]|jgi:pyrimidine operon attenuation protein/uracil phosphoribosyltransferase|nr:bifunctional pyr operon transcriptional regulator/uracil phosphoribosyltransferase PyrR [Coriobacteriales bacterium]
MATVAKPQVVLESAQIERSLVRIAHEICERNPDQISAGTLCLIGIITRGDLLANFIAAQIEQISGSAVAVGSLDISFYRDDVGIRLAPEVHASHVPFAIDAKTVVLVDDVLYTGRTIRAALDALSDLGRPACIQLAVLVDRGHRELPIRPDYIGKNIPSAADQSVRLFLESVDGHSDVEVIGASTGEHIGSAPLGNGTALAASAKGTI